MLARCRALYRDALLERLNAGAQRRAAGTQVSALNEPGRTFLGPPLGMLLVASPSSRSQENPGCGATSSIR